MSPKPRTMTRRRSRSSPTSKRVISLHRATYRLTQRRVCRHRPLWTGHQALPVPLRHCPPVRLSPPLTTVPRTWSMPMSRPKRLRSKASPRSRVLSGTAVVYLCQVINNSWSFTTNYVIIIKLNKPRRNSLNVSKEWFIAYFLAKKIFLLPIIKGKEDKWETTEAVNICRKYIEINKF